MVYLAAYTQSSDFAFFNLSLQTSSGDNLIIKFDPVTRSVEWVVRIPTGVTEWVVSVERNMVMVK